MILVTGATGHFGTIVIDSLLQHGVPANQIAAFVRDPQKAAQITNKDIVIRQGDYNHYDSMLDAFEGVEKLLLISGTDIINRERQQTDAVKAALEAGVQHIYYTSFARRNETESSPLGIVARAHIATENQIISTGLKYTIMRNTLYVDGIPAFVGERVFETGIYFPAGDGKCAFATRGDMAYAASLLLMQEGHENKIYDFCNTENVTFYDIADVLSTISGKEIPYISQDMEVFKDTMRAAGIPEGALDGILPFAEAIREGEFEADRSDLETILGRSPMSVREYLIGFYGQ